MGIDITKEARAIRASHLFGVAEAVGLARALNRLPRQLVIYGIEGAVHGEGLSLAVAAVVERVATTILTELTD